MCETTDRKYRSRNFKNHRKRLNTHNVLRRDPLLIAGEDKP